jgi:hypothetical protein
LYYVLDKNEIQSIFLQYFTLGLCTVTVQYGCMGKTPVPSSPQTCKLMAVIFTAINRIDTVNFSRIMGIRVHGLQIAHFGYNNVQRKGKLPTWLQVVNRRKSLQGDTTRKRFNNTIKTSMRDKPSSRLWNPK